MPLKVCAGAVRSRAARVWPASPLQNGLFRRTPVALAPATPSVDDTTRRASPSPTTTAPQSRRGTHARALASAAPPPPPPLRLLSWEVDAMETTHRHCRRRLAFANRIPWIVETITRCAPDIVALQNSTQALSRALCNGESGGVTDRVDGTQGLELVHEDVLHRLANPAGQSETPEDGDVSPPSAAEAAAVVPSSPSSPSSSSPTSSPRYTLIGAADNGRCGQVQLFLREGCGLEAQLLPSGPGVSALMSWATATDGENESSDKHNKRKEGNRATQSAQFVLSTVDLSYRGKSLGLDGGVLTTAEVSLDGSPFTLAAPSSSAAPSTASAARAKGHLEPHREAAMGFLTRVVQPDVVCGNLFMGRDDAVAHFEDAWVRAGAPPAQERTTNTLRPHGAQRTNYYYFVPSPLAARRAVNDDTGSAAAEAEAEEAITDNDTVVVPATAVGTPLPLTAIFDRTHKSWRLPTTPAAPDNALLSLPEVAGRFQRCLLCRGRATRTHTRHYSFLQRYRRCRVIVVKPFVTVPVTDAWERAWHHERLVHARRRKLEKRRFGLARKLRRLAAPPQPTSESSMPATPSVSADDAAEDEDDAPEPAEAIESAEAVAQQLAEVTRALEEVDKSTPAPEAVAVSLSDQFPLVVMLQ